VDPLSHAALGRTLAALAWKGRGPSHTTAAAVAGALSPDLDVVVTPFGWDRYLLVHEIGTHTVVGTLACAVLTASIVRSVRRDSSWTLCLWSAWLGAASHVLLDLLSSARIRIFWPYVDRQMSIPLVAMADPWLAAILVAALPALWIARRRQTQVAAWVLATAGAFLAMKAGFGIQAVGAYRSTQASGPPVSAYIVEARWASLLEWNVFDRTAQGVRFWRAQAGREPQLLLEWPSGPRTPLLAASHDLPGVRNFLRPHQFAFPVTFQRPGAREWVLWSDIRFCWSRLGEAAPVLEPTAISGDARMSCALWVGGEFDAAGKSLEQIVKIGGFTQTRSPED
jgi:membrane-bound metal-dependent hydrolase YbcI (DUF457 family)